MTDKKYQVIYGTQIIHYSLEYRTRKTLAIEVHPNGCVHVIAPPDTSTDAIEERVRKRASWIHKQQRQFANYPPPLPEREYVSGESWRYLGRQYRLKLIPAARNEIHVWAGRIQLYMQDTTDRQTAKQLLHTWLRKRAATVFQEQYTQATKTVGALGIEHTRGFDLHTMPNRWGSLSKSGRLLINPALIAAPKDCIRYVIIHELCHLQEHNHSPRFYDLLAQCLPEWEALRQRLNQTVELTLKEDKDQNQLLSLAGAIDNKTASTLLNEIQESRQNKL